MVLYSSLVYGGHLEVFFNFQGEFAMNRPVTVTVFGVLNILFAAMGLLGVVTTTAMILGFFHVPANGPLKVMYDNPNYWVFLKVSTFFGFLAGVVLVFAGVGLLMMKNWGRLLSILYGVYGILVCIISLVANYFFMSPLIGKMSQMPDGPEKFGLIGGLIGGVIGGCFGMIYPICLLIFMCRSNVVKAMQNASGTPWNPPIQ
jgi:hypothetical protein